MREEDVMTWLRGGISLVAAWTVGVGAAAALTINGAVTTEGPSPTATVTVWARGRAVLEDATLATEPLVAVAVAVGRPFSVKLEEVEPPLRVEVAAPGHVALFIDVPIAEAATLPPAWLPRGEELTARVTGVTHPEKAVVTGRLVLPRADRTAAGWQPCVPATRPTGDGSLTARAPDGAYALLTAVAEDGRWGRNAQRRVGLRGVTVAIASREVAVKLQDRRGEPVAGARVAAADAPLGACAVTDEGGVAKVQAVTDENWSVAGLGEAVTARSLRRGAPSGPVVLTVEPTEVLEVYFPPEDGPLFLLPSWVPEALTGGAPVVATGGVAQLPFLGRGGTLQVSGRGLVSEQHEVEAAEPAVVLATEHGARVQGRVVNAAGSPVPGVPVWSWAPPWWLRSDRMGGRVVQGIGQLERSVLPTGVSDEEGRFAIDGLPPGKLRVTAVGRGQPPADSEDLTVAAGAAAEIELVLREGSWLAVSVTDPDGRPLRGVQAALYLDRDADSGMPGMRFMLSPRREEAPAATGSSDEEGRVTLHGVPVGHVAVDLQTPGYVRRTLTAEVPETGLDLAQQVLEPGIAVHGRVVDGTRQVVAEARIYTGSMGANPLAEPAATSDAAGAFAIADQPRQGQIFVAAAGDGFSSGAPQRVALPPERAVEIVVKRTRSVEGRVVDRESGDGIAGARVFARAQVQRRTGGMASGMVRSMASAESDDVGRFVLDELEPIRHEVTVGATGYAGRTLDLEVSEDETPGPVTVVLERGLTIAGVVLDTAGAPVAGVAVSATPAELSGSSRMPGLGRTGPDGNFELTGVQPGSYEVAASGGNGERASEVVEAGARDVELRFEASGGIRGRVVAKDGPVPAGIKVRVWASGAQVLKDAAPDGRFEVPSLPPAQYRVWADANGYASASTTATVVGGETAEVELELVAGGTVKGTIRGLSPTQLERCYVGAGGAGGNPKSDGSFTLDGVALGRGEVVAQVISEGRWRSAPYELSSLEVPAEVEIDFPSGLELSGVVRRAGRGVSGMQVQAGSAGQPGNAASGTDAAGRFAIRGLDPGEIDVSVADDQGRTLLTRRLHADRDTRVELDLPSGELTGRVVAASNREPVMGADLRITSTAQPPLERFLHSDDAGAFRASELPDGVFRVAGEAPGYGAAEASVEISMGRGREVVLELPEKAGITLVLREPDGRAPDRVYLLPMRNGRIEDAIWLQCDRDGRARVTSLPGGVSDLQVISGGRALIRVTVPGGEVPVQLVPVGRLGVKLPADASWRVRVSDAATGLVVPPGPWQEPARDGWYRVANGYLAVAVPAAAYTVEAVDAAGARRGAHALVPADGSVEIEP